MYVRLKVVVLMSSYSLLSACGTNALSEREMADIDTGAMALLRTNNQPLLGAVIGDEQPLTQIIAVDGRKLPSEIFKTDEQVAVPVGVHQVELSCVSRSGPDDRDYAEVIEVDFKPHHEYRVRCSFDSDFGPDGTYSGSFSVDEQRIGGH